MTQSVTKTVNNLEQMLSTQKEANSKCNKDVISGMDKTTSFSKIFDKKIEEPVGKTINESVKEINDGVVEETVEEVENVVNEEALTIEDGNFIKNNVDASKILVDFKEILQEVSDETNAETSLDLTLAKDIEEIISQLKEAVENATEIIEKTSDKEVEIVDNVESTDFEMLPEIEMELDSESEVIEDSTVTDDNKNFKEEKKIDFVFEQVISFIDKKNDIEEVKINLEDVDKNTDDNLLNSLEISQDEVIEFSENISDEVLTTKPLEKIEDVDTNDFVVEEDVLKELNIESIKAETNTSGQEQSLMQNQTPEEYAVKAMINSEIETFEIKIDSTQNIQTQQTQQTKPVEVSPSRIIDQVVKHLETLQNNSKVNIVLNPESLGKVNIQLLTTKEGLTAQFTVTTQEARDLIMKGLDGLKESLISHGVGVDNISVKVSDAQKSEYNQDWTEQEGSKGGNKGQKNPDREEKEKGLFEKMMAQTFEEENGNV